MERIGDDVKEQGKETRTLVRVKLVQVFSFFNN